VVGLVCLIAAAATTAWIPAPLTCHLLADGHARGTVPLDTRPPASCDRPVTLALAQQRIARISATIAH